MPNQQFNVLNYNMNRHGKKQYKKRDTALYISGDPKREYFTKHNIHGNGYIKNYYKKEDFFDF